MPEPETFPSHTFASVDDIEPLALMDGLRVRPISGERITLGIFELEPEIGTPEHGHPNEQVGLVLRGEMTFTIGGESRLRKPGDRWVIPPNVPHAVEQTGSAGCTLLESFSPPRTDWADTPRERPGPDRWPPR